MHLQVRIVAAILLLAVLATGTGSVLVLGFLVASLSIAVILFIMARKMIRPITDARRATSPRRSLRERTDALAAVHMQGDSGK